MSLPIGPLRVTASQWAEVREHYEDPRDRDPDPRYLFVYQADLSITANSQEEADARLPEAVQHLDTLDGVCLNILDHWEVLDLETGEPTDELKESS